MEKDKKHKNEPTSNEAAELFSHPAKINEAFTEHEEKDEENRVPKEGQAIIDHYSDEEEQKTHTS
ncbi:hypothetical protein [Halobacillus sp. Marseille-Q1614]|uniref:hypothetical protein n=1 Tax=Halobacillus sp. Marseille-Q1614 TaxID=2709134 RepID=UPI00156E6898|nr:hypothetical protein [Halobacillus sp. Marseille-Q1614]